MYFFFNESDKEESAMATVSGRGPGAGVGLGARNGFMPCPARLPRTIPCVFRWWLETLRSESRGEWAATWRGARFGAVLASGTTLRNWAETDVGPNGKQLTTPLKSWGGLGHTILRRAAIYHKQFTAPTAPAGKKSGIWKSAEWRRDLRPG